jgi:hypothetical protein
MSTKSLLTTATIQKSCLWTEIEQCFRLKLFDKLLVDIKFD